MNVFAVLCLVLLSSYTAAAQPNEDFALVKKDGNISIYERWIIFPKSDPPIDAREVKGEFYFNNTIYAGIKLLQNEAVVKQWQNHVSEFKVYPLKDTTTWLEYSYHDIPWPVSDQDHFLAYKIVSLENDKVFISFESKVDEKRAPVRKSVTRMDLSGSWTFEQITPTKVKATYRILSRPLNIPKWLTDPIIRNNMMTTIKEFIVLIEKD